MLHYTQTQTTMHAHTHTPHTQYPNNNCIFWNFVYLTRETIENFLYCVFHIRTHTHTLTHAHNVEKFSFMELILNFVTRFYTSGMGGYSRCVERRKNVCGACEYIKVFIR